MNRSIAPLLAALVALCVIPSASAIQPSTDEHSSYAKISWSRPSDLPNLRVAPSLQDAASSIEIAQRAPLVAFRQRAGGNWEVRWDARSDRPNLVQGSGIALIPGKGNMLRPDQLGVRAIADINLAVVETAARGFIDDNADLLDISGLDLRLDADSSVGYGDGNSHWFLEFGQFHDGVRVEETYVFVRISNGNVVQFGTEKISRFNLDARPAGSAAQAFTSAFRELAFPAGTRVSAMEQPGELVILPTLPDGEREGMRYDGAPGAGYAHRLAWRFVFSVDGEATRLQLLVDAHSQRVIDVIDLELNVDATVKGGVYATTNTDPELVIPLPFANVTNVTAKVTNTFGVYDYAGGTATSTLNGRYIRMSDNCGAISLASTTDGNLNFGSGTGTDCATPGVGGAGNTHATRTGFYHLTRINEKARSILTTNTWLQGTLQANMNVQNSCNATYSGQVNFYRSSATCANTGEIAAVFLHEWGHGMDANTGGTPSGDRGSGEAVGDTFAFLETRSSCIGPGFYLTPGAVCHNCTTCSGVRDVKDFSASGTRTRATPANVTADGGINCDRFLTTAGAVNCPYVGNSGAYQGVMGYEGHCEAIISGSANWNLAQSLVSRYGSSGWSQMDRIWYGSLTPSKSAYQLVSGGTCNVNAVVNGCGATNWYTVYLAADDDDGNLANGTPNACRIWDAFNAQGIACGATRPECTADTGFQLSATTATQASCAPGAAVTYAINVAAYSGFSGPVTLAATGLPGNATATFATNPVTTGASTTVTISGSNVAAGSYTITINGTSPGQSARSTTLQWTVSGAPAAPASLSSPAAGSQVVAPAGTSLAWSAVSGAQSYGVQLARDAAFTDIVGAGSSLTTTQWPTPALAPATNYHWRTTATSACGTSAASATATFATSYKVGGTISGLTAAGLSLRLNGSETLSPTASGSFQFSTAVARNASYSVTVIAEPGGASALACSVTGGSGVAVAGSNISSVVVTCVERLFANGFDSTQSIP